MGRARLKLELFGGLHIELNGEDVVDRLPGRQGRTLVAYLALNQGRLVSRHELLDVLWPSRPPASPEAALSSVLAKVRQVLGPAMVRGRQALFFQPPPGAYIDVRAIDLQIRFAGVNRDPVAALRDAQAVLDVLALPLLPDFDGEWVEGWRQHFDDLAPRARENVARAGLALGGRHLPAAERAAAAIVAGDPFREGGYALLMEAQARQGNVAEALRTFEQVRVLLRDELGTSPSPSLVALHETMLRHEIPVPAAAATIAPEPGARAWPTVTSQMIEGAFVGREAFSQRLWERWEESRAGQTRLVLLVGEPGVGKTRLAAEFAENVHRSGGLVLYGRADEEALLPRRETGSTTGYKLALRRYEWPAAFRPSHTLHDQIACSRSTGAGIRLAHRRRQARTLVPVVVTRRGPRETRAGPSRRPADQQAEDADLEIVGRVRARV